MLLYDIIESPLHPDLAPLCIRLGHEHRRFTSQRKAMAAIKRDSPDIVVGDFCYGFGNNYAGANVSNLDVMLRSLQRFAPAARIVVLADGQHAAYVDKLAALFQIDSVVQLPAEPAALEAALS